MSGDDPPPALSPQDVTRLLEAWSAGDSDALGRLMPLVADELRRLARRHFEGERVDHTLQPTALVNEVYLRLLESHSVDWRSRAQFFAFASLTMRRILVDHARARRTEKRGAGTANVPLSEVSAEGLMTVSRDVEILAVEEALSALEEIDPRQAEVVQLRYYGGLSNPEIAEVLGISVATVKREWSTARVFLNRRLEAS